MKAGLSAPGSNKILGQKDLEIKKVYQQQRFQGFAQSVG
jgi:hypothetical protein